MINIQHKGSFKNTEDFLNRMSNGHMFDALSRFGAQGVAALAAATPTDTGLTAASWSYEVVSRKGYFSIIWSNSNSPGGKPIAILLQYGHGTRSGGYIQGRDYIMPAIMPVFDQIASSAWKVVTE